RAVNSLQVAASLGATIDADVVYKVSGTGRPEEVKGLIEKALEGEFLRAREVLDKLLIEYGLSGEDIVRQLHRTVFDLNIPDESKVRLLDRIGETDFRLTEGSSERIQIESLLAHFALIGQELSKKWSRPEQGGPRLVCRLILRRRLAHPGEREDNWGCLRRGVLGDARVRKAQIVALVGR